MAQSGHIASPPRIDPAGPGDLDAVRTLFRRYAKSLPVDLGFQGFDRELDGLPGEYAPPAGALLVARGPEGAALGCVALRPLAGQTCEMKRLYVGDDARGSGLGRALVAAVVAAARAARYRAMVLDTLPSLTAAIRLYREAGFRPTAPYYPTPIADTLFLRLDLAGG